MSERCKYDMGSYLTDDGNKLLEYFRNKHSLRFYYDEMMGSVLIPEDAFLNKRDLFCDMMECIKELEGMGYHFAVEYVVLDEVGHYCMREVEYYC